MSGSPFAQSEERSMVSTQSSIYDKIGGKQALAAVVEAFYQRVLSLIHI